jgi:hypothetical protein
MDIGGEVNLELPFKLKKKDKLGTAGEQGASVSGLRYPRHHI